MLKLTIPNGSTRKISHKHKIYKCNWINKIIQVEILITNSINSKSQKNPFSVSCKIRNLPEVVDEEALNEIPVECLTVHTGQEKHFL